jgi:hypothetical protein
MGRTGQMLAIQGAGQVGIDPVVQTPQGIISSSHVGQLQAAL